MLGLIKKLLALVIVVAAAYAGFRWGGKVFPPLERMLGRGQHATAAPVAGPSAAIADSTLGRFERFRNGKGPDRLGLGGTELTSVVRYSLPGIVPPGVSEPTVSLADGRVHVSARVAVDAFPRLPHLDQVIGILPDTVLVEMRGTLARVDQEHLALLVDRMQIAHVPLPRRMIGDVLSGLGAERRASLPEDALLVPLPDGLSSAFVQRDSLVLLAKR